MPDAEAVVGYLFEWMRHRVGHAGNRVDAVGSRADKAAETLYAVLARELRNDPALGELNDEAEAGLAVPSVRTSQGVALALAHAAQRDRSFPHVLEILIEQCQAAQAPPGPARADDGLAIPDGPGVFAAYLPFRGPDSPAILSARASLVSYLNEPERRNDAPGVLQGLVNDCQQALGSEHPFTQTARDHLARLMGLTQHPRAAAAAFEALLSDCGQILGADHPAIQDSARAGIVLFLAGEPSPEAGAEAFQALLTDCQRELGPEHPAVLTGRDNLASLRSGVVSPVPAAQALEAPLADCLRLLGPEHPLTLGVRDHLAILLAHAAGPAAGAGAFKALLADCLRVLGPDDLRTRTADRMLGYWLVRIPSAQDEHFW